MGPFYCPGDQKVYIDLSFYDDLQHKLHSPGDFARAYVVAHEVGHHVQKLLGISDQVNAARRKLSARDFNKVSVRLELQADCFAGIWARNTEKTKHVLEQGDIEEALTAASAIGDDRLQKQARGYASPESFTHGTSKQRVKWFKKGLLDGSIRGCNTFI
jgi:predicted metalloprotease